MIGYLLTLVRSGTNGQQTYRQTDGHCNQPAKRTAEWKSAQGKFTKQKMYLAYIWTKSWQEHEYIFNIRFGEPSVSSFQYIPWMISINVIMISEKIVFCAIIFSQIIFMYRWNWREQFQTRTTCFHRNSICWHTRKYPSKWMRRASNDCIILSSPPAHPYSPLWPDGSRGLVLSMWRSDKTK